MKRIVLGLLILLSGCAGQTVSGPVTASTVNGEPQAVIEGVDRGSSVLVQVRLNNGSTEPIQISELAMTVMSVKPSSCPSSALRLVSYPKPIVAPSSTGMVLVRLGVAADSPRSCSQARWLVNFASQATVAS